MAGFDNDVVYGTNLNFSTANATGGNASILTNGQMLIGTTALNVGGTHINVGTITSTDSSITFGYSSPNITAVVTGGTTTGKTITGDTGGALSPTAGNWNILGTAAQGFSTSGAGSTLTGTIANATDIQKGVATFDENDFLVTAGDVAIANRVRLEFGLVENIGINYAVGTGTFTVQGASGTALSATNKGYVTLASKTAGNLIKISITANQSFIDDNGASQIIGNLFGLTTGVAFTVDVPFFLYAVLDDAETTVAFMISRFPNTYVSPVAAKIGKVGSAVADSQGSFFSLANVTVADYESNPCVCIGSFRMRMSAADDWTVQTLSASNDGIRRFQENVNFGLSAGQFGAASGKYFADNGGTAPAFSTNNFGYKVGRDNRMYFVSLFTDATTAGVGAVNLQLCTPFLILGEVVGSARIINAASSNFIGISDVVAPTNNNKIVIYGLNETSNLPVLLNNQVTISAVYQIAHFIDGIIDFV